MSPEELNFQSFLAARIKDRGISLKKLAEATGIAPAHIESMVHGKFGDLPSAPYVRGYIVRLGKTLDFDGEAWWEKIKKEGFVTDSGAADRLPRNRFIGKPQAKLIWIGAAVVLLLIYFSLQLPVIFGKPSVTIKFPDQNPYVSPVNTVTLAGTVHSANSLSLNGDNIAIAPDGAWEKSVLLQNGLNSFAVTAKKLLGGETSITEQIMYQAPSVSSSTPTSTAGTAPATTPSLKNH